MSTKSKIKYLKNKLKIVILRSPVYLTFFNFEFQKHYFKAKNNIKIVKAGKM